MTWCFIAARKPKHHRRRFDSRRQLSAHPRYVRCQGWIIKSPVLQVEPETSQRGAIFSMPAFWVVRHGSPSNFKGNNGTRYSRPKTPSKRWLRNPPLTHRRVFTCTNDAAAMRWWSPSSASELRSLRTLVAVPGRSKATRKPYSALQWQSTSL